MTITSEKDEIEAVQFCVALGRRMKRVRVARGLSRKDLELRTGIHRNSIARYEAGADVPVMTFIRICVALSVNAGEVLDCALGKAT